MADQTPAQTPADNDEFGDFSIATTRKPVPGVTAGVIPPKLAEMLAVEAPKALKDTDYELVLTAKDEPTAKKLALYARAWGAQQEPKLYIHKVPNRRDMGANIARLAVELDSEVSAENRPGRRAK